jgi:hypothetical protein
VNFDAETGSRKEESISYVFKNVQTQDGLSAASSVRLEEKTVGYWSEASDFVFDCFDCSPIKFADSTSEPPPQKPMSASDVIIDAGEGGKAKSLELMLGIVAAAVSIVATIGITMYKYMSIKKQKNQSAEIMEEIKEQTSKTVRPSVVMRSMDSKIKKAIAKGVEEGVTAATQKGTSLQINYQDRRQGN